jgi:hypothetical protein
MPATGKRGGVHGISCSILGVYLREALSPKVPNFAYQRQRVPGNWVRDYAATSGNGKVSYDWRNSWPSGP